MEQQQDPAETLQVNAKAELTRSWSQLLNQVRDLAPEHRAEILREIHDDVSRVIFENPADASHYVPVTHRRDAAIIGDHEFTQGDLPSYRGSLRRGTVAIQTDQTTEGLAK